MSLEIVDTVYLIAFLRRTDALQSEAVKIIERLGKNTKVSQAALIELDLLMKSRGFSSNERIKTWTLLEKIIPVNAIEMLTSKDFALATILIDFYSMDYFDALIDSQCILRKAKLLTTDNDIISIVESLRIEELEKRLKFQTLENTDL